MTLFTANPSFRISTNIKVKTRQRLDLQSGFTLVELMIALVILAFISFYTAQSIRTTVTFSKKIQTDVDINSEVHAAISLLKTDIARAFNSRDLYVAVYNEAQREHISRWQEAKNKPAGTGAGTGTPGSAAPVTPQQQVQQNQSPPPEYKFRAEVVLTDFVGTESKLNFSSLNGNAIRKSTNASELVEIGYEVKSCKRRGKAQKSTDCLWRRLAYYLDGDVEEGGQESVLIEDVTDFKLKYLRKKADEELEWRDKWIKGDANTENRLPLAVEISLEVSKPIDKAEKNLKTKRVVAYVPINFENNKYVQQINEMNAKGNPLTDPAQGQSAPFTQPQTTTPAAGGQPNPTGFNSGAF